ncbi:MAG: Fic family protein [Phaeodactylibacter sp.]|nr:Fic family protein [Phaeodactylibacter sp.]
MRHFSAGSYRKQTGGYQSFSPGYINKQWILEDPEILLLLSQADRELGKLDMFSNYIPNVDLFISMHVVKEATNSSRIEGTKTNIQEAVMEKSDIDPEKRDDWQEVQQYIKAMNFAIEKLEQLPLSSRLIRETHHILLSNTRGKNKQPGAFRTSQNWIGGATLKDAAFIPPHYSEVQSLMRDLEKFMHNDEIKVPHLIKIALIHYQFETIHPFLDGNGRIGRLLITLYLVSFDLLKRPTLYLSEFLEKHRAVYFDNLSAVRRHNELTPWLKFFLVGIIETAAKACTTFDQILSLRQRVETEKILPLGSRAPKARLLLDHLYQHPIVDAQDVAETTGYSMPSAYQLLDNFQQLGILQEQTGFQRNRKFVFREYLDLFGA